MEIEIRKNYRKNGQIWNEFSYLDGLLHGFQKNYCSNGNLSRECFYIKGLLFGIDKEYWPSGGIDCLGQNRKSIIHGLQIDFKYEKYI